VEQIKIPNSDENVCHIINDPSMVQLMYAMLKLFSKERYNFCNSDFYFCSKYATLEMKHIFDYKEAQCDIFFLNRNMLVRTQRMSGHHQRSWPRLVAKILKLKC
jgi:hypothetical protein